MLSRRRGGRFNGTFRRRRDALLLQLPVMLLMVSQIAASTYVVGARMDEDDAGGFSIPCVQTESLRVVESKFILRGISKAHQADADYNARRRHRSLLQVQAVQSISRGGSHGQRGSNPVQAVQSIENQEPAYVPIYKPYPVPGPPSVIPVPVPSPVDRIVPVPIPVPIPIPIPAPAPISAPSQPPAQVPPVSASLPGPAPNEEKQDRRPPSSLEQTDIRPVTVILFPILNQQPNNPPPRADAGAKHPFNVLG